MTEHVRTQDDSNLNRDGDDTEVIEQRPVDQAPVPQQSRWRAVREPARRHPIGVAVGTALAGLVIGFGTGVLVDAHPMMALTVGTDPIPAAPQHGPGWGGDERPVPPPPPGGPGAPHGPGGPAGPGGPGGPDGPGGPGGRGGPEGPGEQAPPPPPRGEQAPPRGEQPPAPAEQPPLPAERG
ncbi:hypothetical protein [Mycolicibacterium lacusdiani]|uniref:hypothetical protein n=1 Tax=Mycolicibacterium lacusdiani TaxID=2895283 RepID=UPI001F383398|nr:hypothetical protein [Mycolicibacterium lacusdiani]